MMLVHGGAWAIPDDAVEAHLQGVQAAAAAGFAVLQHGGSCLDAVEAAVVAMEDDETFDAGRGSFLNMDGRVQLDACMMDGATLRAGGVGCVEHIRNPIRAAKKILTDSPHVYFVGSGAERFAQEHGLELCANDDLIIPREVERLREAKQQGYLQMPDEFGPMRSHDTVGAVALDRDGNIAAGTSTGGTLNKAPGTRRRLVAHRMRLLRRQPQRRCLHHGLGRADDEARPQQVDRRPRGARDWFPRKPPSARCTT